jgi:uncharacterized protein YaaQ
MKLILAIIFNPDAIDPVTSALVGSKYSVTQISSMGGFLRRGSATLVVGVDEKQVEDVLTAIRSACAPYTKPDGHAATIFVLNASQFVQI